MDKIACPKCGRINDAANSVCLKCKAVLIESRGHSRNKDVYQNRNDNISSAARPARKGERDVLFAEKCGGSFFGLFFKALLTLAIAAACCAGAWYYNEKEDIFSKAQAFLIYTEGKTVDVRVPMDNFIPLCRDENEVRLYYHSYKIGDQFEIENMLKDKRMLSLDYNAKLLIMKKQIEYAKVRVLGGRYHGTAGWVSLAEVMRYAR